MDAYRVAYGTSSFPDAIASSTTSMGDFARYVLEGKVNDFSETALKEKAPRTVREEFERWRVRFFASAKPRQKTAFKKLLSTTATHTKRENARRNDPGDIIRIVYAKPGNEKKKDPTQIAREKAEAAFLRTLSEIQREDYRIGAKHYIAHAMFADAFQQSQMARFDRIWAQRWVCQRAHELGWTEKRFKDFDNTHRSHGRNEHRVERIGKKYQWIALYELIARMSDHLMLLNGYAQDSDAIPYQGPWQISCRDMDPSLLITKTAGGSWAHAGKTWWSPVDICLPKLAPRTSLAWLHSDVDVTNSRSLIEVADSGGRQWLVLDSFRWWHSEERARETTPYGRDVHVWISTLVVNQTDLSQLLRDLRGRTLTTDDLPQFHIPSDIFIGEHPWHPAVSRIANWFEVGEVRDLTVRTLPTVGTYTASTGGHDHSIDDTVSIHVPAPWLADMLGMTLKDGMSLTYADSKGRTAFFDPMTKTPGPHAALVDRDSFLSKMSERKLIPVWVVHSRKSAFGDNDPSREFGGEVDVTGVYVLKNSRWQSHTHMAKLKPSIEQFSAFLGEPVPPRVSAAPLRRRAGESRAALKKRNKKKATNNTRIRKTVRPAPGRKRGTRKR